MAAAEIEPEAIARPVRTTLLDSPNVHFVMAEITEIDCSKRILVCSDRSIFYDYLILATGSLTDFFCVPGAQEHSFELKNLEQGIVLRNRIVASFERAALEPDHVRRRRMLSFAIVGAGPTGVEFAGALSELVGGIVPREYPVLEKNDVRITLIEAADSVLPGMPAVLQRYTRKRLEKMGVEVLTGARVGKVTPGRVECSGDVAIESETVIWSAGVCGGSLPGLPDFPDTRGSRLPVDSNLQVRGLPQIYAVGDIAFSRESGSPLPMMAPVATSQGTTAAENILARIEGRAQKAYHYNDRGNMVTIGRNKAEANVFGHPFTGPLAWLIWLVVHLFNLIGFRNHLMVLLGWSWDYFFFERTVKLILPAEGGLAAGPPKLSRRRL